MKIKTMVVSALLFAGASVAAHAQAAYGDLILGFELAGNTTNLEVDLGSVSSFIGTAPGTYSIVTGLGTDLSSTYGSGWNTNSNLNLGVVGSTSGTSGFAGQLKRTLWVTSSGTAYSQSVASLYAGANSNISALYGQSAAEGAFGGVSVSSSPADLIQTTAFSGTTQGILTGTTLAGSWTSQEATGGSGFSIPITSGAVLEAAMNSSGGTVTNELYMLNPGSGPATDLGTFSLNSSGDLTFTALSVIPEPSTYAMILGVFALGFVMLRRRHQVTA